MPKPAWLLCCEALGVLPPEPHDEVDAVEAIDVWRQARKALVGIFVSVNKRREEVVREAKVSCATSAHCHLSRPTR